MKCICRKCKKIYDPLKSRADYKGYCSQKCLHEMAKQLGYKKHKERWQELHRFNPDRPSEYKTLHDHKALGDVLVSGDEA